MDDSIDLFDESFAGVGVFLEELRKVFSEFTKEHTNIEDTVKTVMRYISHAIKDVLNSFNENSHEVMKSYFNIEIAIPNLAISINDYDHVPQAPPKEKSVKEIAIENFKSNMENYQNSKVIRFIKKKFPVFLEGLIFNLICNLICNFIFNAIGMH